MFTNGDTCRTGTVYYNLNLADFFLNKFKRIDKCCGNNNCSTVLVIVEDGNIADFFEFALDFKATGSRNIFKIYSAK